ncbi:MAG: citrate synthase [Oscillospiraceae bacterium]|nr:citrate synthase [Oscillospiraceae bacterium]
MNNTRELSAQALEFVSSHAEIILRHNKVTREDYQKYDVKRGLRNNDGTGVLAGVTRIGNVRGYYMQDGEKTDMPGQLFYRGYEISDLVGGFLGDDRYGYEETAYLLLFGELPDRDELEGFKKVLAEYRHLPDEFTEKAILAAPSRDIMNKLSRAVLNLYTYDPDPEPNGDLEHELHQAMHLVARFPVIVANAYAAKRHYFDKESLVIHMPKPELSTAENFLAGVRTDSAFTHDEARLLDLCMVLHAEHGGGNNSAFACRVLSSSGTDIYSAIAAAVGALKGPRHGAANKMVMEQFESIKRDVHNWKDDEEIMAYLRLILDKKAGDGTGLIYGMGHAVYTLSDPRAVKLKTLARELADKKDMLDEFELIESVERLTPTVVAEKHKKETSMCANVDLYSGFVYKMLNIPVELYTPLFAVARVAGWCAHRIEEVYNSNKIMRPAYKAIEHSKKYTPMNER